MLPYPSVAILIAMIAGKAFLGWLNRYPAKEKQSMPEVIDRDRLRELVESGAQLVEVLPAEEYEEDHLPAAVNLPLRRLETTAADQLEPDRPVIVYCWDAA